MKNDSLQQCAAKQRHWRKRNSSSTVDQRCSLFGGIRWALCITNAFRKITHSSRKNIVHSHKEWKAFGTKSKGMVSLSIRTKSDVTFICILSRNWYIMPGIPNCTWRIQLNLHLRIIFSFDAYKMLLMRINPILWKWVKWYRPVHLAKWQVIWGWNYEAHSKMAKCGKKKYGIETNFYSDRITTGWHQRELLYKLLISVYDFFN